MTTMPADTACDVIGVDDIEDIIGADFIAPNERYENKKDVVPKVRKRKNIVGKKRDELTPLTSEENQNLLAKENDGCLNIVPGLLRHSQLLLLIIPLISYVIINIIIK